jgi:Ca-activated chloride channel family protein
MNAWQFTLLGYPARLAEPEYLLLCALAVLGVALSWLVWSRQRRALADLAPGTGRLREVVAPGAAPGRQMVRQSLGWMGLLLGGLAMAEPQCGGHSEVAKSFGIDVVIAIDASRSMLARDVKPSRLERAKLELSGLLDKLPGDRVGLVVFAGDAFVQCPLTSDFAAAKLFLKAIDPSAMPVPGTDVARAMETSEQLLTEAKTGAKGQAIVLLTDGEDFSDGVSDALKSLKDKGIRVLPVGIGSAAGEPIPEVDKKGNVVGYVKDRQGNTVMSRLDEDGLQKIADATDGVFIRSVPGSIGVAEVADELSRMEKTERESRITVSYDERYAVFLGPALALLALGAMLRSGRSRAGGAWVSTGLAAGLGVLVLASLGFTGMLDLGNSPDLAAAETARQTIFLLQAGVALGLIGLSMVLDLMVERVAREDAR